MLAFYHVVDIITVVPAYLHTQPTLSISCRRRPPTKAVLVAPLHGTTVMTAVDITFHPLSELPTIPQTRRILRRNASLLFTT